MIQIQLNQSFINPTEPIFDKTLYSDTIIGTIQHEDIVFEFHLEIGFWGYHIHYFPIRNNQSVWAVNPLQIRKDLTIADALKIFEKRAKTNARKYGISTKFKFV